MRPDPCPTTPGPDGSQLSTVSSVVELYLVECRHTLADGTVRQRQIILGDLSRSLGSMPIAALKPIHLIHWIRQHDTWHSPSTIASAIKIVKRCFAWAVSVELCSRNPAAAIPKPADARRRALTAAEFRRAVRASAGEFRRVLYFLVWTGCRPGELRSLKWQHVMWEHQVAILTEHKTAAATGQPRVIALPDECVRMLRWIERHRNCSPFVFYTERMQPWTMANLSRTFERLRWSASLPRDAVMYGARHFYGTEAIDRADYIVDTSSEQRYAKIMDPADLLTTVEVDGVRVASV